MEIAPRRFTVESVEPTLGPISRRHITLTALAGEGIDVIHLWTGDPDLVSRLVPGASLDLAVAPEGEPA